MVFDSISRDKEGIYLETDKDGAFCITEEDVHYFRVGEKGKYSTGEDSGGAYIKLDKRGKLHVDLMARE